MQRLSSSVLLTWSAVGSKPFLKYVVCLETGWASTGQKCSESLEPMVNADGALGHMFNLSRDIFTEAGLVLGQHSEQRPEIKPPLAPGHPVPGKRAEIRRHELWWFGKNCDTAYSKSVTAFSSVTGLKEMTFLLRPSTHAVPGELANTRPGGETETIIHALSITLLWFIDIDVDIKRELPWRKFSVSLSEIHWIALTPNLVPKFLSKGEGAPPWSTHTHTHTGNTSIILSLQFMSVTCKATVIEHISDSHGGPVPAEGAPARWPCSRRRPSPRTSTACGWNLSCSIRGIFHSC